MNRFLVPLILVLSAAVAWSVEAPRLRVACGSSVLWDMVRNLGGDRVQAIALVPVGSDPHATQPGAAEATALASAQVVVINGLGFEGWFDRLAKESGFAGSVVVASRGVQARQAAGHAGHDHAGHDHGPGDPHAWMDLANGQIYADNIRDGLIAADPAGRADYTAWAEAYAARLRALDAWTKRQAATLPVAKRRLVTTHDAAGYFAAAYGFEVRAPGASLDDAQPGAQELAAISAWIRAQQVPAVFLETGKNNRLVERLAEDAGVRLGGDLYLDTIPPPEAGPSSYEGMFLLNVRRIVGALSAP
jgi:zinc/manganese transport system substrate-binding protein